MIHSNERKLSLSGWLKENNKSEYDTPLKLQKFLLFYECFTKAAGEEPDFSHLRGYKRGPVFSHVWGDYTKERPQFDIAADNAYQSKLFTINRPRAEKSAFLMKILTEAELSELTHKMNLWKSKEDRILSGEYQVDLFEQDFNQEDINMIRLLDQMYPDSLVANSKVLQMDAFCFVFSNEDAIKLTERHLDILSTVALNETESLHNPVFVAIDDDRRLILD